MSSIAELIEKLEREPASQVRDDARALVGEVLALHADGLGRLLAILRRDPSLHAEAMRDPLIESLVELHELQREAPAQLIPVTDLVRKRAPAEEPCDLCAQPAGAEHVHLLDSERKVLACVCVACRLALTANPTGKYREVPKALARVSTLDDAWWKGLGLPVGLAFFVLRGDTPIAHYPGPAGTIESALPVEAWSAIAAEHPAIATMAPDVHALLVDRTHGESEHWVVGIDRCYALVERVRRQWRGFAGGDEVRVEKRRFFDELAREAQTGITS